MAFTEAERVKVRHYLGFSRLNVQGDPRLESAISAVQSVADQGSMPDSSTETHVRDILAELADVEAKIKALRGKAAAMQVDELKVDPVRAAYFLKSEGRRLVSGLAFALDTKPLRDVFSSAEPVLA